jgi:hypothetical protein
MNVHDVDGVNYTASAVNNKCSVELRSLKKTSAVSSSGSELAASIAFAMTWKEALAVV